MFTTRRIANFAKTNRLIYPTSFEEKLGFTQIRQLLSELCLSSMGKQLAGELRVQTDFDQIRYSLSVTDEFVRLLQSGKTFPVQNYFNLLPELQRIRLPGTFIFQEQLFDLKSSLETIAEIQQYLSGLSAAEYPHLHQLGQGKPVDSYLLRRIHQIIDEKGHIRDTASPELQRIRSDLQRLNGEIDRIVRQVLLQARKHGWVNPTDEITIRGGRMVIPIQAAHKRKIKGFVHDESATGQTVFIEPAEALEANNEIIELQNAEKREIIRILTEFTDEIRPHLDELTNHYHFLGQIDFIRARALLALQLKAVKPLLTDQPLIQWFSARHPLLYLFYQKQHRTVVPYDIELNQHQRILVISGPNAGGKSVCLKTVGLLQYMLQCGMLIPVAEQSTAGVFRNFFIDIGDEQSLEDDLSTYTSHLRNLRQLIRRANGHTLFLLDEFGSGTDPQFGGAIAEAILEYLNSRGAFGVVTTHYSNLKELAGKTPGMVNGAMLFDLQQMTPLFQLRLGQPGSSFAFEIAKKTGLPWFILRNAEKKTGKTLIRMEFQLQRIEAEKRELEERRRKLTEAEAQLKELQKRYEELFRQLRESKDRIMREAREEAERIISESNRLIERTIREIREAQAEKVKTRQLREQLKTEAAEILRTATPETPAGDTGPAAATLAESPQKTPKKPEPAIQVGNRVRIPPQLTVGEVIEINGDQAAVSFGNVVIRVPLDKLTNVGEEEYYQKVLIRRREKNPVLSDINERMANFSSTLDIRGMRAEEVIPLLTKYLDEAILLSVRQLKIIHGKGDGILRKVVRDLLKTTPQVEHWEDEHIERGGSGATIVRLK